MHICQALQKCSSSDSAALLAEILHARAFHDITAVPIKRSYDQLEHHMLCNVQLHLHGQLARYIYNALASWPSLINT